MRSYRIWALVLMTVTAIGSCKKNAADQVNPAFRLSYGDSVLYMKSGSADYTVSPLSSNPGTYDVFPKGLDIDPVTGVINVTKSDAGMRYKIVFTATTGETYSTNILLAGINYLDKYYNLSQNDSIAYPVYNGDATQALPSGNYDMGGGASHNGLAILPSNGQINLKQCVRNGLFGNTPKNEEWEEIEIKYTSNDRSASAVNSIKIIVYYYNTINDVPQDIKTIVQAHQAQVQGTQYTPLPASTLTARNGLSPALLGRPRPPCVIIVGS